MFREPASVRTRRPGWEAALLAGGFVGRSLAALVGLAMLVNLAGGSVASAIAATAGMILLLSFATLRGIRPTRRSAWVPLLLLTP